MFLSWENSPSEEGRIGSPRAGVTRANIGALEASDGAIDGADVLNRSSYKGLFLVCLVDL